MEYAYWRKCDFQLHSPRDPNWNGQRPVGLGEAVASTSSVASEANVEAERVAWASTFVDQCLERDLGAVAITDHNEMVMVTYVQREIAKRNAAEEDFDLWLFPGMELTAQGGKQCLILFDAELEEDSSELVMFLDVNAEGDRTIDHAGAIDRPEICDAITSTMEGGEKAFKDRHDKYGY